MKILTGWATGSTDRAYAELRPPIVEQELNHVDQVPNSWRSFRELLWNE